MEAAETERKRESQRVEADERIRLGRLCRFVWMRVERMKMNEDSRRGAACR